MLPLGVTIPANVPQRSEILEGLMNYPVLVNFFFDNTERPRRLVGRAVANAISRRSFNAQVGVQSSSSQCWIYGGKNDTVTGFSPNTSAFTCQSYHQCPILTYLSRTLYPAWRKVTSHYKQHVDSYRTGTGSFPGVKRPGRGFGHPTHQAPRLKEE